MRLIAHRGNIMGPNPVMENSPNYIEEAISEGFDVEIDLRVEDNNCYLGHDDSQYFVTMDWLGKYKNVLWIHCKNLEALKKMSNFSVQFNYFWHQEDDYTLTSKNHIWTYPGKEIIEKSILVMPEWITDIDELSEYKKSLCYGICSDYIFKLK